MQHFVTSPGYSTIRFSPLCKTVHKMLIFPGNFMAKNIWYY